MRWWMLVAGMLLMTCHFLAADELKVITAAEAVKQVGAPQVIVEMTVKKAKDRLTKRGIVFLDSEDDFTSPNNLGVAISAQAAAKLKAQGIANFERHFQGKSIRVRGCIMVFETRPYLPVNDPAEITIVDKK